MTKWDLLWTAIVAVYEFLGGTTIGEEGAGRMKTKEAMKLVLDSARVARNLSANEDRYDYYVWLEGVAGEYKDLKEKEMRKQLEALKERSEARTAL